VNETLDGLDGKLAGSEVLDMVADFIGPYLALPDEHALTVLTLWAAHTHLAGQFYVTPRLILDSAEPESGKSRVLEMLKLVCYRPKMTVNTTIAALYRRIGEDPSRPLTVLMDEVDAYFNPRTADRYEDLRALLNAGYKRGATVDRCVGEGSRQAVVEFPVFAPAALAGLGGYFPATIRSRAIEIHMRRRLPTQQVTDYDEEITEMAGLPIRDALAGWAATAIIGTRPPLPAGVTDRAAECWRPLLAIADAAGGDWPKRARAACGWYVFRNAAPLSLGVRLLMDLRTVFGERDRLPTTDILAALYKMDESPWRDLKGKPLDATRLSAELGRYEVHRKQFRWADGYGKSRPAWGYVTYGDEGLGDAWARYLGQAPGSAGYTGYAGYGPRDGIAVPNPVTGAGYSPETTETTLTSDVTGVPGVTEKRAGRPRASAEPILKLHREGLTVAEIVARTGVSEAAVRRTVKRQEAIEANGWAPDEVGDCQRCRHPHRRYGPHGSPLCAECRPA
jgi:Protein of unknown function (DUF3631)/Homeodomain-like domain